MDNYQKYLEKSIEMCQFVIDNKLSFDRISILSAISSKKDYEQRLTEYLEYISGAERSEGGELPKPTR
jgi:hypothetical protein